MSSEEINIDELEVSLLMLVKSPKNHETTANFLSRRGWPTSMENNLQRAIKRIPAEKPDFILISLNFPHPSIGKMAPLFKQTFGCEVVLFCENMDAAGLVRLSKMSGDKLTGAPSGPNVYRTVRRLLQEKLNPESVKAESSSIELHPSVAADAVTIRGEKSETVESRSYTIESQATLSRKKLRLKDIISSAPLQIKPSADLQALLQMTDEPGQPDPSFNKASDESAEKYEPLHKAVIESVKQLGSNKYSDWTGGESTGQVFAIPVESTDLYGFLIINVQETVHAARDSFFQIIEKAVSDQILQKAKAKMHRGFEVGVPSIDFQKTVENCSIFRVSAEYFGMPFCVAFVETEDPIPKLTELKKDRMLKVAVEEISSEFPVTFKAYLRLEKNDRYFLYLKSGRHLLPEQKNRLRENNITDICVKQIDEVNIRRFLLYVKIQESIKEASKISS